MLFAIASLVLSAILMTQADVNDIVSDVTNVEPFSEELYIFDVTSDAPVADLKGALESASVDVRYSFQVLGTRQYFFAAIFSDVTVVVDDGSDALSQLTFPEGSLVTQYPVELVDDTLEMFGLPGPNYSRTVEALDDKNLVVMIRDIVFPEGFSTSQMKSMLEAMVRAYTKPEQIVGTVNYAVLGRYPLKSYIFMNLDENSMQKAVLDGLDLAGGPGNNFINFLRLRNV